MITLLIKQGGFIVAPSSSEKYLYSDLTWPEVNDAVSEEKVILIPVGSTEQHGSHLPLDVDNLIVSRLCLEAGRKSSKKILVAPAISYGYNVHAMDYPGTMHVGYQHFINYCSDVCKSFAYHGFKRIIIVNGHGSNIPLLDLVSRRIILETNALAASFMWWNLLTMDPEFIPSFRESFFPGGAGHAGEIETSIYLHLAGEKVQMEKAKDHIAWFNRQGSTGFQWGDAFGSGPISLMEWTSSFSDDGTYGQPSLASAEKGELIFKEAVTRLLQFVEEFQKRSIRQRVDHHNEPPKNPLPQI